MSIQYSRAAMAAVALLAALALQTVHGQVPNDALIRGWVVEAFAHDPRIDATQLTVDVDSGIVTLGGNAATLAASEYAEAEARKIAGVRGVVNELSVDQRLVNDRDIESLIRSRIETSTALQPQNVVIESVDGIVTLTGWVDSPTEADAAELLAKQTAHVRGVLNQIDVRPRAHRADREIRSDVINTLRRDVFLTGLPLTVTVQGGVVTLTGTVGDDYERVRAELHSRIVNNVRDVENYLIIDPMLRHGARTTAAPPTDIELRDAVISELQVDSRLSAAGIDVNVADGHVMLEGTVPSARMRALAEQDSLGVVGVAWVTNGLHVIADAREDWLLKSNVDFRLHSDSMLHDLAIVTVAHDGRVTLLGEVASPAERSAAGIAALDVRGVTSVSNEIVVRSDDPLNDAEIVSAIARHLDSSSRTRAASTRIHVAAEAGVVTLTGDVDTFAERLEAARIASHAVGVWRVRNGLTVRGYAYPWNTWSDRAVADSDIPTLEPLDDGVL